MAVPVADGVGDAGDVDGVDAVGKRHHQHGVGEGHPRAARPARYVEDAAPGADNAALRRLARATIEMAQHVKHSETPTRREAGIVADAVIQLANMLRRLSEPE